MAQAPEGLDPSIQTSEIAFEANVQSVTPFLKLVMVSRHSAAHHTFARDEGPSLVGRGSAPTAHVLQPGARAMVASGTSRGIVLPVDQKRASSPNASCGRWASNGRPEDFGNSDLGHQRRGALSRAAPGSPSPPV